jgi:electron-transferring-flavoprotein dehydrogenase
VRYAVRSRVHRLLHFSARCINEGGFQSIPKLTFPGGMLIGCSAGFLNLPKIKGTHTAMKSGMVAADAVFDALCPEDADSASEASIEVAKYEDDMKKSWVWDELKAVRNVGPSFRHGMWAGVAYSGFTTMVTRGMEPWTLSKSDGVPDSAHTKKAAESTKIQYPKPDGVLSFDILTNLQRSGTNHDHDQPAHLRIKPELAHVPNDISIKEYDGPEQRFCPARVYEYAENEETGAKELVINAQNCVHCKCCSIKMPQEYIKWTVPMNGGPAYDVM